MKSAIAALLLFIAALLGFTSTNVQAQTGSSRSSVRLVEGEYLSTGYIQELKKTRSPMKADKGGMELVQVRHDGNKFVLEPIINFHEGDSEFALNRDGSVAPVSENVSATVLDDHTIRFGYGEFTPATYISVKDAAVYVSNVVLVGRYKDEHGRRYEFRDDGWAIFPNRKFQFEIGLDHVLNPYDYFMDAGKDKKKLPWAVWAFNRKRDTFQIFRTKQVGGLEQVSDVRPYLVLRRFR